MKKLLIIPMLFMCSMVIGQSKKIIGKPIKIENLEVAQNDFPKVMTWKDAKAECAKLGKGWRLPTKDELNLLYQNKDKIGGFADDYYCSSTQDRIYNVFSQKFKGGIQFQGGSEDSEFRVRAVRGESSPMETEQKAPKNIIGTPMKIDNLEVAQHDFPYRMNWYVAQKVCAKLGKGWSLPTKDELNIMYENKDKIGGFGNSRYWSSTEYNNNYAWSQVFDTDMSEIFDNGKQNNDDYKGYEYDVRAVRGESSPMKTEQKAPKQIIGKPIRLQKFEVAQHDFPESMYWGDAKAACADLGAGWRLPTKDELNVMYKNKKKIDGFADGFYWSSTEFGSDHMRALGVGSGNWLGSHKGLAFHVRAVRAF